MYLIKISAIISYNKYQNIVCGGVEAYNNYFVSETKDVNSLIEKARGILDKHCEKNYLKGKWAYGKPEIRLATEIPLDKLKVI